MAGSKLRLSQPKSDGWVGAYCRLLVCAAVLTLGGCGTSETTETAPPDTQDVAVSHEVSQQQPAAPSSASPSRQSLLVDVTQLKDALRAAQAPPRLLDVRPEDEYLAGHIPGAVFVDVEAWKAKFFEEGGATDEMFWADAVGRLGIDRSTAVVVYGDTATNPARVWWTLRYLGLENVRLLDGGWQLWLKGGGEVQVDVDPIEPVSFAPQFQHERLISKDLMLAAAGAGDSDVMIVDTRSRGEFTGRDAAAGRAGHIPGAVNIEWLETVDESGRFKSSEELQTLFQARGIDPRKTLVTHCQSGGRSSVAALALELAGFRDVKNYYCGWQEWSADPTTPVEQE
jgi:thiosulfate/3-mercaptopyruvate sulfurtransferase